MRYGIVTIQFFLFQFLVMLTWYLFSLKIDFFSWGNSTNDGLYFLVYYFIVLPIMIIIVGFRFKMLNDLKVKNLIHYLSHIIFILLISYQPLINLKTNTMYIIGVFSTTLVILFVCIEHFYL